MGYSEEEIHELADEFFGRTGATVFQFSVPLDTTRYYAHDTLPSVDSEMTVHELRAELYRLNDKDGSPVICSICNKPVTAITARQEPARAKIIALHRRACRLRHPVKDVPIDPMYARPPPGPISIRGMDKALVLLALYKCARVQGMGVLQKRKKPLTISDARDLLKKQNRFDYLYGRVLKIDLRGDELETGLYDRDNGPGAARSALIDAGLLV